MGKMCSMCKTIKSISDFFRDRTQKDGYHTHCKLCDYSIPRKARQPLKKYSKCPPGLEPAKWYKRNIKKYKKGDRKKYTQSPEAKSKERKRKKQYYANLRANSPAYRKSKAEHDKRYRQTQAGKVSKIKAKATRKANGGKISLNSKD